MRPLAGVLLVLWATVVWLDWEHMTIKVRRFWCDRSEGVLMYVEVRGGWTCVHGVEFVE